jgi:hypothetical protein
MRPFHEHDADHLRRAIELAHEAREGKRSLRCRLGQRGQEDFGRGLEYREHGA